MATARPPRERRGRPPVPDGSRGAAPHHEPHPPATVDFRSELLRKGIHLSSIVIPIFYFYTPRHTALVVAAALTAVALALDAGRHYYPPLFRFYDMKFGAMLRSHESDSRVKRLNGGTYVLIAATLSIFLFPKLIAISAFLVLIVSDLCAALVGRKFGRRRFLGKSVEGSLAFLVTALLIVAATPKIGYLPAEYAVGAAAAIAATIVEASPTGIDDNLSIPLTFGGALWAGYAWALPHLDLYKFG